MENKNNINFHTSGELQPQQITNQEETAGGEIVTEHGIHNDGDDIDLERQREFVLPPTGYGKWATQCNPGTKLFTWKKILRNLHIPQLNSGSWTQGLGLYLHVRLPLHLMRNQQITSGPAACPQPPLRHRFGLASRKHSWCRMLTETGSCSECSSQRSKPGTFTSIYIHQFTRWASKSFNTFQPFSTSLHGHISWA